MIPGNGYSLGSQPNGNDLDEIRSKGVVRIAALAARLNGKERPDPAIFKERMAQITKNYMLSYEDANEVLSDATMALKKGKDAYTYLKEGKPSYSVRTGKWMGYLKNITQQEYESAFREIHLSDEGQEAVLDKPFNNSGYTAEQKTDVINNGKRPNNSDKDLATGIGKVF
jgi:hypothetical protein